MKVQVKVLCCQVEASWRPTLSLETHGVRVALPPLAKTAKYGKWAMICEVYAGVIGGYTIVFLNDFDGCGRVWWKQVPADIDTYWYRAVLPHQITAMNAQNQDWDIYIYLSSLMSADHSDKFLNDSC